VIRIASVPDILVVPSSIGVTDIAGLVSYAASHSTSMAFASSGMGTARHVLGEAFNQAHSLRAVHVPYSGSGPAINSLLAAEVHYMFEGIGPALPHIRSGALRALAVSQKRVPSLPGVPSFKEVGIEALSASSWYGVFLPRRAAHTLVTNLNERIAQALDSEALRSNWRRNNADYLPHSPLEFSAFIHEELLHWNSLVKAAGVVVG
jgi:tripartite-type tricarboxylate transporter receptor subunit TctC